MLAILPLQDWLATDGEVRYQGNPADERINIPAIPRHYWRYRMHCTLESLSANDKLNAHLRALAQAADRNR
jgi:4-alpha-glucanotransferase